MCSTHLHVFSVLILSQIKLRTLVIDFMQEPVTVELETELVPSQCGTKNQLIEKKYTFQYVPLLDGLQALLSKQEILDEARKFYVYVFSVLKYVYINITGVTRS